MDLIQDVYDFFQSNYKTYCSGPLFKLFRVIDLKLAVFLRTIFKSSLTSWEELVDRYTTKIKPDGTHTSTSIGSGGSVSVSRRTSADKMSGLKRLSVGNKFSKRVNDAASSAVDAVGGKTPPEGMTAQEDGMIPASITQKKLFLRNSEVLFPMETRTPLFQAELVINEGKMILEPSVEDIQGGFVQAVDKMVSLPTLLIGPPHSHFIVPTRGPPSHTPLRIYRLYVPYVPILGGPLSLSPLSIYIPHLIYPLLSVPYVPLLGGRVSLYPLSLSPLSLYIPPSYIPLIYPPSYIPSSVCTLCASIISVPY